MPLPFRRAGDRIFEVRGFSEKSVSDTSIPSGMLGTTVLPGQPDTQDMATPWPAPGGKDLGRHFWPFQFNG